jgi:hypothetical protein
MKNPDLFHTLHSCMHAVYWSNPLVAMIVSDAPCPWCGGEIGIDAAVQNGVILVMPDGTCRQRPWERLVTESTTVNIQHQTDNVCCKQQIQWPGVPI